MLRRGSPPAPSLLSRGKSLSHLALFIKHQQACIPLAPPRAYSHSASSLSTAMGRTCRFPWGECCSGAWLQTVLPTALLRTQMASILVASISMRPRSICCSCWCACCYSCCRSLLWCCLSRCWGCLPHYSLASLHPAWSLLLWDRPIL